MSYSAHRPGKFGSEGQIEIDAPTEVDEPLYLSDVLDERERAEAEGRPDPFADGPRTVQQPVADETLTDDFDLEPFVVAPRERPEPEPLPIADADETQAFDTEAFDTEAYETQDLPEYVEEVAEPEPVAPAPRRRDRAPRERAPRGSRLRQLAILGGADGVVLDQVPNETPRFVQMFFVLAGTALVSGISMFFALTTAVQVWIAVALPLAIVWALIIYNLDRFLTSSMRSTKNGWKLFALAAPRVIMAALIGVVVAEPLVLQIFHNDVIREVTATNIAQAQADQDALATGPEKQALDAARERLNALENQAATGIVTGTSSESASIVAAKAAVDKLNEQMTAQQAVIDQARAMYQCELTGEGAGTVPGCTGVAGEGSSSGAAQAQLAQAQSTYDGLAEQLRTANEQLATAEKEGGAATAAAEGTNRKEAQDALPTARETYENAKTAYDSRAETVASGNSGAVGLLSQITALNRLSEREPTLGWAHWLIAALFFMIELLPVLVKVLTSYGNPSVYEQADEIRKQVAIDKANAEGWRERAAIAAGRNAPIGGPGTA